MSPYSQPAAIWLATLPVLSMLTTVPPFGRPVFRQTGAATVGPASSLPARDTRTSPAFARLSTRKGHGRSPPT